jgi:hypothetical protein
MWEKLFPTTVAPKADGGKAGIVGLPGQGAAARGDGRLGENLSMMQCIS